MLSPILIILSLILKTFANLPVFSLIKANLLPYKSDLKEDIKPLTLYFLNELSKKEDILIQDINKKALDLLSLFLVRYHF